MPLDPLAQPPFLHNLLRLFQLQIGARDVAAEELKLAAYVRAFEEFGWGACECCDSRGVGEGGVEFGGCGAEFFGGG